MHVPDHDHDHGAGFCAKVIFFALMAILLSLVVLIVIENRDGSDVDTPLSESRFSEYLQGWVDEKREEDHHDEPILSHEDHDDEHEDEPPIVPENEPYPEEKDISNPDENDESQELNAEINVNESDPEAASTEQDEIDDENDQSPNSQEDENLSQQDNDDDNANIFEDSQPFEEEVNFFKQLMCT